ncbi:bifunctional lytic transglycosylase/C40 family peptidase [Streptomyces sp. WMMC500]|uniref:C40 family peptidase n=1 Tax=Streptomyces sp. WMMC500 TaxID=3015154 RepID=UPI00248B8D6E|nr:bifunctional lytic transglycosylase/C40 family peptidase [Streptomyces sp. WMMC500]WBB62018.1 bifunctional lytic transglycosylase/C40 family peptidase [Streptomyces sp. WMMC500]
MIGGATDGPAAAELGLNGQKIPDEYEPWVLQAGELCDAVSPALIAAQIDAESGWDPHAVSPVGATGMSQFMPGTWATWGVDADGDGEADPRTPADAIMTQGRYDCWLAEKVRGIEGDPTELMLAGYNAGPGAVQVYGGIPPYPETQAYVSRIQQLVAEYGIRDSEPGSEFGARVVRYAKEQLGVPYSWGGGGPGGPSYGFAQGAGIRGFDCSSLVQYAVYHASDGKVLLPRVSQAQATVGDAVPRSRLLPGDAIGFVLNGGSVDHIGIYLGSGQFIHAPRTGDVVKVSELDDPYYASKPQDYRRYG